jgi:drug/metabolite transporter (DMT)-like permease
MAGASVAAIFVCLLSPILITLLSTRLLKEALTRKQVIGIGVAVIGTLLVVTGGTVSLFSGGDFFLGSLVLLITPVLWATYSILGRKMIDKYDPFLVVAYITLIGGLCLIPYALVEGSLHHIFNITFNGWLAILYLAITCSLLGYYLWFYMLKWIGAAKTSSFLFAEPLITVLFTAVFVGEEITLPILVGGVLIFMGVRVITTK